MTSFLSWCHQRLRQVYFAYLSLWQVQDFPPGHFYSPLPNEKDVLEYINSRGLYSSDLPDVKMNRDYQFNTLSEYQRFYKDLPFPEQKVPGKRYFYGNHFFDYSDAIFLYSFLRKNQPRRVIEVGSGFSSAVMLDTVDSMDSYKPEMTFIDPDPERLLKLLRPDDNQRVKVIAERIQKVSADVFTGLESGDLLFIDSSHVLKCGSDLQFLLFKIIPILPVGVFVHFHDVFYPFDYPDEWLKEGRSFNENYLLRAFLSSNDEWSIQFFNHYVSLEFGDFIQQNMPLCSKNPGGSLYIRREPKGSV